MPKKDIVQIAKTFQAQHEAVLSVNMKESIEMVVQSVLHETIKERPGFQVSDEHVWSAALNINKNLKPLLSNEGQKNWANIYNFVYEKIGKDVEDKEKMEDNAMNAWSDLQKKHKFKTYWSYDDYSKMPPDLENTVFPLPIKVLVYSTGVGSGWGKSGQVKLPKNATYFDVWKAANDLIVASEDLHHSFIEDFYPMKSSNLKEDGVFAIVNGS